MPTTKSDAMQAARAQITTIGAGSDDARKERLVRKWLYEQRDDTQGDRYAQLCFRIARDIEQDNTRNDEEWMQELRDCLTALCQLKDTIPVDADTGVDQTKVVNLMRRIARGAVTHVDAQVREQARRQLEHTWEIKVAAAEDPRETKRAALVATLNGAELDADTLNQTLNELAGVIDQ